MNALFPHIYDIYCKAVARLVTRTEQKQVVAAVVEESAAGFQREDATEAVEHEAPNRI